MSEIVPLGELIAYLGLGATVTNSDKAVLQMLKDDVEDDAREFVGHGITQETYTEYHPKTDRVTVGPRLVELSGDQVTLQASVHSGDIIALDNAYVRSITDIREDYDGFWEQESDDFPSSTALTEGEDFALVADSKDSSDNFLSKTGFVERQFGNWPAKAGTVRVTYVAGFTATELDTQPWRWIKGVIREETAKRFKYRQGMKGTDPGMGAVESFSVGGQVTVRYGAKDASAIAMGELTQAAKKRLWKIKRLPLDF